MILPLEVGKDFTFVDEEYRVQVGGEDFRIDLLCYDSQRKGQYEVNMQPYLEEADKEEQEYLARRERQRRLRRERLRRQRRRRRMKIILTLSAVGIFAILFITVTGVIRKTKADESRQQSQKEELQDMLNTDSLTASVLPKGNAASGDSITGGATWDSALSDEEIPEEAATEEGDKKEAEKTPVVYSFTSTSDTANIYSDQVISSHAILIDESTDTIVASKGAKERISPASMTKVLTVLVAAEHIEEEDLDDTLTMTLDITDYAYVNDCSSVGFLDGEEVPVRDLFYGTILPSGGDAAVGLATYVAGSHEAFVDMMNEKLEEIGLADSAHFTNCVGLYDDNHYCTVYDMAVIMKAAMQNEFCKEVLSAHTYTTTPTDEHPEGIQISNWFLRRIEDKDTGGEVLCAKTGYVVQSGNCAVSYGTSASGTPYICVTSGSTSSWRCIYDHVEIYNRYVPDEE